MSALSRLLTLAQASLLLGLVLWLASPLELPEVPAAGTSLLLALAGLGIFAIAWIPSLRSGPSSRAPIDAIVVVYVAIVAITACLGVDQWQSLRAGVMLAGEIGLCYGAMMLARRIPWLTIAVILTIVGASAVTEVMALAYHAEVGFRVRPAFYPVPVGWSGYPELSALLTVQLGCLIAAIVTAGR